MNGIDTESPEATVEIVTFLPLGNVDVVTVPKPFGILDCVSLFTVYAWYTCTSTAFVAVNVNTPVYTALFSALGGKITATCPF